MKAKSRWLSVVFLISMIFGCVTRNRACATLGDYDELRERLIGVVEVERFYGDVRVMKLKTLLSKLAPMQISDLLKCGIVCSQIYKVITPCVSDPLSVVVFAVLTNTTEETAVMLIKRGLMTEENMQRIINGQGDFL